MTISPFKIDIMTEKTLFIVANIPFVKELKRSCLRALQGEQLDFSFYRTAATEKALEYINTGKEFIESIKKGDYQHKAMNIALYLTAPVFIIPESVFYPEKPILVIDTGSISLNSDLTPYSKDKDYKAMTDPQTLYDRYLISLSNFQVSLLDQGLPNGLKDFQRGQGTPAISDFNV